MITYKGASVEEKDIKYSSLSKRLAPIRKATGLTESASFLLWFLQNIYRLDETDARDAICDHSNDKGIDGIFVNHDEETVHFLQSKVRQKDSGTIGDVGPKQLVASVQQFDTRSKIESVLSSNADTQLKQLIERVKLPDLVDRGYELIPVYVSNETHDKDSLAYSELASIRVFDRQTIASHFIEASPRAKKEDFVFDTSYVEPLKMSSGTGASTAMYVFPARALQLVHMEGIADGTLFRENVRYNLGSTPVNRSIKKSIETKSTHSNFALFHNGIIILCDSADDTNEGELKINGYSVVNGAQSLTSFFDSKSKLTDDLRVLVRVVEVADDELARTITENSNNQNAIKPRDLRSNHIIMLRLQKEVEQKQPSYFFEIKRGESHPQGKEVISNDLAGRALLAFDVQEPWSAHQVYKVFDEKYSDIFGRPQVTADRIVFLHELGKAVDSALIGVKNRPMASYTLTRYFLLYVLSQILRTDTTSAPYVKDPSRFSDKGLEEFVKRCSEILKTMIVDLNYETKDVEFDYKSELKSPASCQKLATAMMTSYEKDVARGKADSFEDWVPPRS